MIFLKSWLIIRHWNTLKQFRNCFLNNAAILIWFQILTFILNIALKKQILKLMCLLKYQTAFLMIKMKKFKNIIKCSYHLNGFKSLFWKGGRVCSRAPPANTISINESKRQIKSTESWNEFKKKCVKQSEKWCDTVSEKAVIQNLILYKNDHL